MKQLLDTSRLAATNDGWAATFRQTAKEHRSTLISLMIWLSTAFEQEAVISTCHT
ncbi:hypothetical protein ACO2Q0_12170 [Phenylobacterium sp. VNQ135]|uniref:hypothetical protein n=1 Tax=Phenylobacterium sp. VNQ135 TaxID=3400922 RepID=UPI003C0F397E